MQVLFGFLVNLELGAALSLLLVPLVTLPLLVVHYRRYGRVGRRRALAFYLLVISVTFMISLTLFPLPDPDTLTCVGNSLMPFKAVGDAQRYAERHGWGPADLLANRPLFQYLYNVLFFMPLGILLRRSYRRSWSFIGLTGAAFSGMLELTQATGAWGLYDCAYRVGDIDDLIANTLGCLLGAAISPLLVFIPFDVRDVTPAPAEARPALPRRVIATGIDLLIAGGVTLSPWSIVMLPVLFVVLPAITGGATPGKWLLRLRIRTADGVTSARPGALAIRALVLLGPWIVCDAASDALAYRTEPLLVIVGLALAVATLAWPLWLLWAAGRDPDGRGPHDQLADTQVATHVVGRGPADPAATPAS